MGTNVEHNADPREWHPIEAPEEEGRPKGKSYKILGALTLLLVGIIATYINHLHNNYEDFNERLSELSRVKIGDAQDELLYSLGNPTWVGTDSDSSPLATKTLSPEISKTDYRIWQWLDAETFTEVEFNNDGEVARIRCYTVIKKAQGWRCATVGGISTTGYDEMSYLSNSSEQRAIDALGNADEIFYDEDAGAKRKSLVYNKLGVQLTFAGGQLQQITKGPARPGFFWWLFNGGPS